MKNGSDLYCQIFIDTEMNENEIVKTIKSFINGKIMSIETHIKNKILDIQINLNEEYDETRKRDIKSGFLFYPYYLDIFPSENNNEREYISHIKQLISFLEEKNCVVVAACDFEDELDIHNLNK